MVEIHDKAAMLSLDTPRKSVIPGANRIRLRLACASGKHNAYGDVQPDRAKVVGGDRSTECVNLNFN